MRDFKGMKRQRGRNRSGGGGGGGGGGGKPSHNVNRAFDSNGPDNVKIRGHAQHVYEKYQQLARDASASGDRVLAENYLQHAEHYFRVLRSLQPNRPASEIVGRDALASGFDIDFEDEGGDGGEEQEGAPEGAEGAGGEERGEGRSERQEFRGENNRDNREGREGRPERRDERREDRGPRRDRFEGRRDERGPREGGGRYGEDRPGYGQRAEEPRGDGQREADSADAPAEDGGSAVLRSEDGGVSQAPAFLQASSGAPAAEDGEPRRRTRTRRRPRSFEGEAGADPAEGGSDEG